MSIWSNITGQGEAFTGSYLNQCYFKTGDAFKVHTATEVTSAADNFERSCETYRINALSTTGVFVGATMTDQGSIVSSQFVDSQRTMAFIDDTEITAKQTLYSALGKIWIDHLPTMSEASLGAHPYISAAREGWYAPQKLANPGHWTRTNDRVFRGRYSVVSAPNPVCIAANQVERWPVIHGQAAGGTYWFNTCDDGCSQTFVTGLAPTTTFRITVRMCLELGVVPANDLSSFAVQPPLPDPVAIELYDSVVSEMIDAYPSADNDLNRFFSKAKEIAGRVLKVVDPVLGVAGAAGVPYAKTLRAITRGLSGEKGAEYLDDEEGGLEKDLARIKEEKTKRALAEKIRAARKQAAANAKAAKAITSPSGLKIVRPEKK